MTSRSRRIGSAVAIALVAAFAPAAGRPVDACSCAVLSYAAQYDHADVVFLGRAVHSHIVTRLRGGERQSTTFESIRVWKGPPRVTHRVTNYTFGPACGFTFEPGRDYVVYASHQAVPGAFGSGLWTNLCTGTTYIEHGDIALRLSALGSGTPMPSICSQVAHRLPPDAVAGVLDDPWRFVGYGQLADPGRPPSPYNPERTRLSLRNPHAPPGPMNAPTWKAYCP